MKKLLIPGDEVVFNLIDLFSELNEKRTEFMRVNINDFFGDSFIANIRRNISPPISPLNARGEQFSKNFTENAETNFVPRLRGTPIINFMPPLYYFARTNTCPLLKKLSTTLDLLLAYSPVSSPLFFVMLTDQLSIIERFTSTSSSRVMVCEVIEKILQSLISVKSVFVRLHDNDVASFGTIPSAMNISHRVSPRRQVRDSRSRHASILRREDSLTLANGSAVK